MLLGAVDRRGAVGWDAISRSALELGQEGLLSVLSHLSIECACLYYWTKQSELAIENNWLLRKYLCCDGLSWLKPRQVGKHCVQPWARTTRPVS